MKYKLFSEDILPYKPTLKSWTDSETLPTKFPGGMNQETKGNVKRHQCIYLPPAVPLA